MKILIDIPNDVYTRLIDEDEDSSLSTIIDDVNELMNSLKNGEVMSNTLITETSMHHLICSFCDNDKCVRGTKECEFEKWKEKQESEDIKNA